ncbi:DNA mismatch repair endonuclease MutL [Rufibacter glacialis]|uniref:DNA mismatch repair protein MutL n=1 Tax=Rufibacter glacialis TaxID=1259555 RepID=A0A5M8QKS6_9BACT|nr:DNA mismatch repair endonuclease MutL [Rufibacter glacialis]KAA6435751.1 DNA mismatch repair endonuclease MutL [Rufibacter glacialis]GGK66189.1 DNA mismatch repair protein MutL [Rufibacter glacialis]
MADIIRLLPEYLANQIAAGEVVQRPASVVKELLENSVDAGSTSVTLIIKDAGKQLIQVVDDGLGMTETDARMCFERHATSKIKTTEDLFRIKTMGFRGEAMASIAAVAQVELKTRARGAELGTCLTIEGNEVLKQEPVAMAQGTVVSVKNLFFNVPARRNFLKTNPVEMRHILDEFQRVALANPEIAFALYQNEVEVMNLPAGKLSQRIVSIFGKEYKEQMAACEETTPFLTVKGYIGKPEYAKKSRGEQFFFVNNRFIKSQYLNHAVLTAFEGLLPKDSFPFYVLFLEIAPETIDINVHPTKTEIKFEDEKTVYAIVRAAVKQSLGLHNIAPSLDFGADVNYMPLQPMKFPASMDFEMAPAQAPKASSPMNTPASFSSRASGGGGQHQERDTPPTREVSRANTEEHSHLFPEEEDSFAPAKNTMTGGSKTLQVHQKYLMVQVKSGLMVVDQQAAQERILYEKYSQALGKRTGASQQLLFPQTLQLSPADFSLVMELTEEFTALGFVFNDFGSNTLVVNGIPAEIPLRDEKELIEGLLEQYKNNLSALKVDRQENLARAMAKRVASRLTGRLSDQEMNALVDRLFGCQVPNYTPSGQKTLVILQTEQLQDLFLRN